MSVFTVPSLDEEPWPTLGPAICDLIEERCVHGPGDLRGQPARIDDEKRAIIYRAYQVYPRDHPRAGRRRFKRVAVSVRKGVAKTELAAWCGFAELHPEGEVRTDGWKLVDGIWQPVGRPVVDPYMPMLAFTEDQTNDLAYAALYVMCTEGPDADLFDATLEQITRAYGDGKAVAVATAPDTNDGARTTWQHFDESHRLRSERHKAAVQTMRNNLPKRVIADAWEMETTTTYAEGENSVAEDTHTYAEDVAKGTIEDEQLFFYYRWAPVKEGENLDDPEQCRAAIREASGPAVAQWPFFEEQVDNIRRLRNQPDTDRDYWERVWLNRRVTSARQAFDVNHWKNVLARPGAVIAEKEPIVLGFDGARWRDACVLIATHIETGLQFPLGWWEKPAPDASKKRKPEEERVWEVTDEQVDGAVAEAFERFSVVLLYADPPRWEANVAKWAGLYGEKRVMEWYTNRPQQIGRAFRAYRTAMTSQVVTHNGDERFARHIGNARKGDLKILDDDKTPLWTIYKPKPDSPLFIDGAMAGCLSWQARLDALRRGGWQKKSGRMLVIR